MRIFLIGYRCAGKSAVGRQLAEKLGLPFYDTDQMIITHTGKTIRQWVEEQGWEAFRSEEKKAIREIPLSESAVIALGGGAILDPENREWIKKRGRVVWLTAGFNTILERMRSDPQNPDNRPSLSDQGWQDEIQEILAQRTPLYRQLADIEVDTEGKGVEDVTAEILQEMDFIAVINPRPITDRP